MNSFGELILKSANRLYQKIRPSERFIVTNMLAQFSGQEVSNIIAKKLISDEPTMICRFGMVELYCLLTYYSITQNISIDKKLTNYIKGQSFPFWWDSAIIKEMAKNAGFINPTTKSLEKFCQLMQEDMKFVDILGSWMQGEELFDQQMPDAIKVNIWDLEPYKYQNPWSQYLKDKTILVVHPFEDTIKAQYKKRKLLFSNPAVLPEFNLKTIKAVQSIAYNQTRFKDWFEALDYMKGRISDTTFDVAIIGCGAYGFPLAAHVKRIGKKAVHLGGATQILFGIKGKRWEEDNYYAENIFNEHWVRPSKHETPERSSIIEGNCYW